MTRRIERESRRVHVVPGTHVSLLAWTSKLDVAGYSEPAGPGYCAGHVAGVCDSCYAKGGRHAVPSVRGAYEARRAYRRSLVPGTPGWANGVCVYAAAIEHAMRGTGRNDFRWWVSGDFSDARSVLFVRDVCRAVRTTVPDARFWIPTRAWHGGVAAWIRDAVARLAQEPDVNGVRPDVGTHASVVATVPATGSRGHVACGALTRGGRCAGCTACFDPRVQLVTYTLHAVPRFVRKEVVTA